MAVTNLAGTKWELNFAGMDGNYMVSNINFRDFLFTANGETFSKIMYSPSLGCVRFRYSNAERYVDMTSDVWDTYKNIFIIGEASTWGSQMTNATLIAWFLANAVQKFEYWVTGDSLGATAEAIRTKGGTSEQIEWKGNGFADAITALQPPIPSDYGHITFDGSTITVS